MRHNAIVLSLLLAIGLTACGRQSPTPSAAAPAASTQAEAISRIGDVSIRASAVQTSALAPAVASQYGITRDDNTVLLLVGARKGPEAQATALSAQIEATVTDLRGQQQTIAMREIRSGELFDYVGTVDVSLPDTLRFDLTIKPEGGAESAMQFSREFFPQ